MTYDHSKKAGNRGDVWKHAVLLTVADAIPLTSATCHYVDCHSGAPAHALRTGGEWDRGVGAARRRAPSDCSYFSAAADWLSSSRYPAGWVFVVNRLASRCEHVRVDLSDVADAVAATYSVRPLNIPRNVEIEFRQTDGFAVAAGLDRADLVFLDPPFHPDAEADWRSLNATCHYLAERGLPFLAWYPVYWPTKPQRLVDTTGCVAWEVLWTPFGSKPAQNLLGCGMLASRNLAPLFDDRRSTLQAISRSLESELLIRKPTVL